MTLSRDEKRGGTASAAISIIILNWNGSDDTIKCLESLYRSSYRDYDLIVVDNGSSDASIENLRHYCEKKSGFSPIYEQNSVLPVHLFEVNEDEIQEGLFHYQTYIQYQEKRRLILIKNAENYGYAKGNNIGVRFALNNLQPEYILILNNDTILIDNDMLAKLVGMVNGNNTIGAVSPTLRSSTGEIQRTCTRNLPRFLDFIFVYTFIGQRIFKENRIWQRHFNCKYLFDHPEEFGVLGGSCILFRSQALVDIGLFDENTFLYWEEYIIGSKLARLGWKSMLCSDTEIIHMGESCIKNLNLKSWARYWSVRSELYYIDAYASLNTVKRSVVIIALLTEAVFAILDTVVKGKKSKFDRKCEKKLLSLLLRNFVRHDSLEYR